MRVKYRISGQVQGVGFRPFVYNLASSLGLAGFVANDTEGAVIEVEGSEDKIKEFYNQLVSSPPPLAKIKNITTETIPTKGENKFVIDRSIITGKTTVDVTIDTAICEDCLRELFDSSDRRFRYPFINCTNCGPRYTITKSLPYDRPNTTMADFKMCDRCKSEYEDPSNRRFHAQPIACWDCGPKLYLQLPNGKTLNDDPIKTTVKYIIEGKIVAIKGIGGFHLAVDARNTEAVKRLRSLKKRDYKPFAIMVKDLDAVEKICIVDDKSKNLLIDISRPIVLLPKRKPNDISPEVAPDVDTFGVMLPYAPHHYLLFEEGLGPIVMTSGNISDEPIISDNEEAINHLGPIADLFLMHNRPIYRKVDDSVVQSRKDGLIMIRRARGFVPQSIDLGEVSQKHILAVGAELKNTIGIAKDSRAIISEHLGDLKNPESYENFINVIEHLCKLYDVQPEVIVADLHNDYLSTRYALDRLECGLVRVQHHHSHIVSCMVENGIFDKVIGISADGVGLGTDGTIWGCEVLIADRAEFVRVGHLEQFALPGGDSASKQLFRPALALLYNVFGYDVVEHPIAKRICPDKQTRKMIIQMIDRRINSPLTSSLGRLFDAVANIIGIAHYNYYEAQAPMKLESIARGAGTEFYPYTIEKRDDKFVINIKPMIKSLTEDLQKNIPADIIADKFHNTVAEFLAKVAILCTKEFHIDKVVFSGGCFANKIITDKTVKLVEKEGLSCYLHKAIPPNDGGIALGQLGIGIEKVKRGEVI